MRSPSGAATTGAASDLTAAGEASVHVACPGRQARWIRPRVPPSWPPRRNPRRGRRPGRLPFSLSLATTATDAFGAVRIRCPGPYDGACAPGWSRLGSGSAAVAWTVISSTADRHSSIASVPEEDTGAAAAAARWSERPSSAAVTSGNQRIRLDTQPRGERRYALSRTGLQTPGGRVVRDGLARLAPVPGRAGGDRLWPALVREGRAR
jgi:hypothetical protein